MLFEYDLSVIFMKKTIAVFLAVLTTFIIPFQCVAAENKEESSETVADFAKSSILMCADTGDIIYEKNAYEHLSPASVTKIMSILLVLEAIDSGKISLEDEVTAGENAADLGGMQVITSMTDNEDALRLVFESYAKIWATLGVDTDAAQQIVSDVHSPAEIRVNAVLSSVDKFYDVYSIAESDRMYVPTDKRVRVW